ncbi:glucose-1-phosphate adenylyltransferase large subunit 1 [Hibiscus syriacus]|uniref:Glucose-1-phosphate adenylyltransferase large subunit 1 n=1 Tax=Hibiscus syriacus TaxID=106335 RepID=A0A6A3C4U1_HIBSY|nr:glucose-1-phosphate adenylyltransferase large subunit 1 [Hibiscus syriacus]
MVRGDSLFVFNGEVWSSSEVILSARSWARTLHNHRHELSCVGGVSYQAHQCRPLITAVVTKVARMLAVARHMDPELEYKSYTVMALLDGGMLRRHKSWLKAEPTTIVVATIRRLSQMLEKQIFKLDSMRVLVVDEICGRKEKHQLLISLLQSDLPKSGIIFVGEQVCTAYP